MVEHEKTEYVSGVQGLATVRAAGINTSKTPWYAVLPSLPGVISIGRRYYVPRDIVQRMANGGQSCPECDARKAEAQVSMPASNNLSLSQ